MDQELEALKKALVSSDYNTQEEKDFFAEKIQVKKVSKGEVILREGQYVKASYHLYKGCIREYYLKDGEERTVGFYTAGDNLTGDGERADTQPSSVSWECMVDSIVSVFSFEVEREMFRKFPRLESMCRTEVEKQYSNFRTDMQHFRGASPGERYEDLMKAKPELFQFVPLYHIASYLGVKPESLSRIRNRMRKVDSFK